MCVSLRDDDMVGEVKNLKCVSGHRPSLCNTRIHENQWDIFVKLLQRTWLVFLPFHLAGDLPRTLDLIEWMMSTGILASSSAKDSSRQSARTHLATFHSMYSIPKEAMGIGLRLNFRRYLARSSCTQS